MCGIVGYRGNKNAKDIIYQGLKKLEYRGYDSSGLAIGSNLSIKTEKGVGTIDEVSKQKQLQGDTGIGHTRWATHGGVTQENAHPHKSQMEKIAVVHNGIINNYQEIKQTDLKNTKFTSETDTEVIPHLLEKYLEQGKTLKQALEQLQNRIEGNYAIAALTNDGKLGVLRKGSPLVIGVKENETFVASDVTPIIEHTKNVIFLEDNDYAVISDEKTDIYNQGREVNRPVEEVEWNEEQATREGYDHYMEKEIKEQSKTVKRAVYQDESDLDKALEMIEKAEKIYVTGCGTASFAASLGTKYLRELNHHVITEQAHELEYRKDQINENDLVIAVSQSGETADLLSLTRKVDAPVLSIVNVVGSSLARESQHKLYINAGPEIGVASTKAFTGKLAVFKLIKYHAENKLSEGRKTLLNTAEQIDKVLETNEDTINEISEYLKEQSHVFFIGRDKGHEVAKEADLKLKELSYIHSESFPGGEFKHGNLALIEQDTPLVAFLKDDTHEEIYNNMKEAHSRGAKIITVGKEPVEESTFHIKIPEVCTPEIVEVIPFQYLAYLTSVKKGNNPDKPRNLAKSVTVK